MPTAHCVSTIDGVILAVDAGFLRLMRRTQEEVVGSSYREFTHPVDLGRSAEMLSALVDRAAPVRLRKRYVRPDGSLMTASVLVTRFDEADRLVSTLFWNEDEDVSPPARLREAALRIARVQLVRRSEFGHDLSTDAVGGILIAIYLAEAEGRVVTGSYLAEDAGIARAVAGHWIDVLVQRGLVERGCGRTDDVHFTHAGLVRMERLLSSVYEPSRFADTA